MLLPLLLVSAWTTLTIMLMTRFDAWAVNLLKRQHNQHTSTAGVWKGDNDTIIL
jgi:hypothetical protein